MGRSGVNVPSTSTGHQWKHAKPTCLQHFSFFIRYRRFKHQGKQPITPFIEESLQALTSKA